MSILFALQSLGFPLQVARAGTGIDQQTESIIKSLGIPLVSSDVTAGKTEKPVQMKESLLKSEKAIPFVPL